MNHTGTKNGKMYVRETLDSGFVYERRSSTERRVLCAALCISGRADLTRKLMNDAKKQMENSDRRWYRPNASPPTHYVVTNVTFETKKGMRGDGIPVVVENGGASSDRFDCRHRV